MKVWRVGHKSALNSGFPSGPYTCAGVPDEACDRLWGMAGAHSNSTHPSPQADPLLRGIQPEERCGFDTCDALNEWFDGWTDVLHECGFEVWAYEVPDWAARVGRNGQVVFLANEAVEIGRHAFTPEQMALFA
ncbi:hypothetical protein HXS80_15985 [Streptomyces sp. CB04723]|uniref:hypothetical protein n=1 Tax=Streptomyces TaxID=1883 RepID=UPI0015C4A347|nr:hypothetical protein [Streptomyces sp. CB04723]QLG33027.1 hypothetical protein HXS80_15985 [Streptomyces sp. CB04723]